MHKLESGYVASILIFLVNFHVAYTATNFNISTNTTSFSKGFTPLFGEHNIFPSDDDRSLQLHLNQYTGSGFRSSDLYNHGLFSAKIKLPSEYTAGIVVAFYTTNGEIFEKTHDELDFEFLGNIKGKAWRFQTNMYGNGSTSRGREERYYLWFDPSKHFHRYTILWTPNKIIFFIDDVPIREIVKNDAMGGDFPSKPMGLYATIWDASDWATSGGKYKANYKYAPFVAEFTDLVLHGCVSDPLEGVVATVGEDQLATAAFASLSPNQKMAMKNFREKYIQYSYCYDTLRYPTPPPECVFDPAERRLFKDTGMLKFDERHHRRRFKQTRQYIGTTNHDNRKDV
ncbi:hypothetical protein ACS0TY_003392 [Phlomoides rotata]